MGLKRIVTTVTCDACGSTLALAEEASTPQEAAEIAAGDGWHVGASDDQGRVLDLCPTCGIEHGLEGEETRREAARPTFRVSLYAVNDHGATPVLVGTITVKAESASAAKCAAYDALWTEFHRTACEHDLYVVTKES